MTMDQSIRFVDGSVQMILEKYSQGFSKNHDSMVTHLAMRNIQSSHLVAYLRGLRDCIALLNRDFEVLVNVVMKIDWTIREDIVVQEYQSYVVNLVSAHTYYLRTCLHSLVRHFYPRQKELPEAFLQSVIGSGDDKIRHYHDKSFTHVHTLIKSLCRIVPAAPAVLVSLLEECFPHYTRCVFTQECYIKNLLTITRYLDTGRLRILNLIVDRMVQIDVRCPRRDIEASEQVFDEDTDQGVFDMESEQETRARSMKHNGADKLDVMMQLMLVYVHNVCHSQEELNWEATKKLYRELLCIFEKVLIPTYGTCHVQFIWFYLCSLRAELYEGFLDFLWKYVQNPNTESIHRQSAVAYIASILARATYINVGTLQTMMNLMCGWLHTYLTESCHTTQPDIWRHGPFYSICQAVFYAIAFRHKDILETKTGHKWVKGISLQTLITSRLNPLKACLPVVTRTFSPIARMHQFAFCDAIIEHNNRSLLPIAYDSISPLTYINKLDSFFPFDSYLLVRSSDFVSDIYREFEGVVHEEDAQEVQDEDEFLDGLKPTPPPLMLDLMHHSVSPGFKDSHL